MKRILGAVGGTIASAALVLVIAATAAPSNEPAPAPATSIHKDCVPKQAGKMRLSIDPSKETKGSYSVSCCCGSPPNCVSKTCSYPDGTPPSPTCNCTGSQPSISC